MEPCPSCSWWTAACLHHQAVLFLEDPPAPSSENTSKMKKTNRMMLAVSPWRDPTPRFQYQCSPTLGGSPARAGGSARSAADSSPPAAACACIGLAVTLDAPGAPGRKAVPNVSAAAAAKIRAP